ncbi:hypothetical protein Tco_1502374 [Tanacetum coccineum]
MLVQGPIFQGEGSTVPVESYHTPTSAPSTLQPPTLSPSMQTTHVSEEAATMSHDSPLLRVRSLRSDEGSMTLHELMLIIKVKKLENKIKSGKARRRVILIVSEYEGDLEDSSKQGRKIAHLDEDKGITLVQMGAQTRGRHEHDLEPDFEFTAPEEVYTAEPDISTTNVPVSTAGAEVSTVSPEVKTAAEKERKRIARVHEEADTFNAEEWDNIQAQIEADEELAQKQKTNEEQSAEEEKELSEEEL